MFAAAVSDSARVLVFPLVCSFVSVWLPGACSDDSVFRVSWKLHFLLVFCFCGVVPRTSGAHTRAHGVAGCAFTRILVGRMMRRMGTHLRNAMTSGYRMDGPIFAVVLSWGGGCCVGLFRMFSRALCRRVAFVLIEQAPFPGEVGACVRPGRPTYEFRSPDSRYSCCWYWCNCCRHHWR